jgi:hypothetical protein
MKQYTTPLLTACLLIALLSTLYVQNNKVNDLKTKLYQADSIQQEMRDELFNARVEAGRYELSLEHLKEVNPKAALEFDNFMQHETE